MTRRQARTMAMAAGLLAALALVVRLAPVGTPPAAAGVPDTPMGLDTPPDWPSPDGVVERYAGIVEGNLFAPDRTPPPLGLGAEPASQEPPAQTGPRLPRYRLSGVVQGPDGFIALIDADPAFPGAELYQVGDSVGPFVLEQATDSLVVLRSGSTLRTLRLDTISGRLPR